MGLDKYGYPATYIANEILFDLNDFGADAKKLESSWYDWLQYNPFDYRVAEKLTVLLEERVAKLDPKKDAGLIHQLEKKITLTKKRALRYGDNFSQEADKLK